VVEEEERTREEIHDDNIKRLAESMDMKDGETMMAGFSWTTKSAIRYHELYPQVLGMDCTHKTNAEERPLFRVTGVHADGTNLPLAEAMLPSEQLWVFSELLQNVLPSFFGESLKKTKLIISDEDPQYLKALDIARDLGIYGEAKVRRTFQCSVVNIM
jgi:hypothetical protein